MKSRVVVAAVIEKGDSILLCRKPRDVGPYPNKWLIIGGGVKLGEESIRDALVREIREEADIEVSDIEQIGFDEDFTEDKNREMTHYIYLSFRAKYRSGEARPQDDVAELKWFPRTGIPLAGLCEPSIRLFRRLGLLK